MIHYNANLETHPDGAGDLNAIINGNWRNAGNWFNPATSLTASQSGTTVTASADVFNADDVGASLRFADGTVRTIATVTSATIVEVTVSGAVSVQAFEVYRTDLDNRDALMRGLAKRVRMLVGDHARYFFWNGNDDRLERGQLIEYLDNVGCGMTPEYKFDVMGDIRVGAPSGAQGSRIIGRGEHTSEPAGTLAVGEWELAVIDDGGTPVFSVRYNDGGTVVGTEWPLAPVGSS